MTILKTKQAIVLGYTPLQLPKSISNKLFFDFWCIAFFLNTLLTYFKNRGII